MEIQGKSSLARHFGVSRTTVDSWVRRGCPYEDETGRFIFDSEAVEAWRRQRDRSRGPARHVRTIAEAEEAALAEQDHRTPGQAIAETVVGAILLLARQHGPKWNFREDPDAMELVGQLADTIDGV